MLKGMAEVLVGIGTASWFVMRAVRKFRVLSCDNTRRLFSPPSRFYHTLSGCVLSSRAVRYDGSKHCILHVSNNFKVYVRARDVLKV